MRHFTLNRVFALYLIIFVLIVVGIVPRIAILPVAALLLCWAALAPLEDATLFFVRAIPLFIALPLTTTYDNLNLWRPFALILVFRALIDARHALWVQGVAAYRSPFRWMRAHPTASMVVGLFVLAAASLIGAFAPLAGAVRIVYFVNLLMAPVVLWLLIRQRRLSLERIGASIALSTGIAIVVGYLQLATTYVFDIYQFMRIWGEGIQLRQFGTQWSHIATHVGNTWLAYYGPQLSLRVFSLFTDSHTFPMFVILGLPALVVWVKTRSRWAMAWIPAALLIIILSGTRGIWAAAVPTALGAAVLAWHNRPFRQWTRYMALFFALFAVAWPIFISPQFLLGTGIDIRSRIRSIVDFGETSNAQRILIWKSTVGSIAHHPALGIGIGNFPVVLGQDIRFAKAGSTAHNVYLHVAAEIGIPAGLLFIALLANIALAAWRWLTTASGLTATYASGLLLACTWVFIYLLTDAALFDERAFLAFGIAAATILAHAAKS